MKRREGGKIILKNEQLIFIIGLLFIAILSLNAISASEIGTDSIEIGDFDNSYLNTNDNEMYLEDSNIGDNSNNNQNSGNDENPNPIATSEENDNSMNDLETDTKIDELSENQESINEAELTVKNDNAESPIKTRIVVMNVSVQKERMLILKLVDSKNKTIANKRITVRYGRETYTNTTDKFGRIRIKISFEPGNYTVKVTFSGDGNYTKCNRTFIMHVYKLKTSFNPLYTSIIKGKYFYACLKDKNGAALASMPITLSYRNKNYSKKTDNKGMIRFKINSKPGKYKLKLNYKGSKMYLKTSKTVTVKSYNAKTKIVFNSKSIVRNKYLYIILKYNENKTLANKKLLISFANKNYKKTTDKEGKTKLRLTKPVGTYKIKVRFEGSNGFLNSSRSTKIKVLPNYTSIFTAKNKTVHLNGNKTIRYYIRLTDLKGNPIAGETVILKVKCNNFTSGSGKKITKKTIVLSSDNIVNKSVDKKRMNDMAKLLRAKGYKVIVSGIGPNYHVNSVRDYKNVCAFHLVGGIDSGMFVDMSHGYYQNYLKYNNNQFVLGCPKPPNIVNLANRTWLKRAHDDDYSPKSFKGLYFPGKYLNKKTHVNYVYGDNPQELVDNFLKYAKKGKSYGMDDTIPGSYTTYKLTTSKNGYVHLDLPIGNRTVVCSLNNKNGHTADKLTTWVNVIK